MRKLLLALLFSLPAFGQVTVSPFVSPGVQFLDNTGRPLNAGKVCTFAPNSTTPQAAYSDSLGTALLPNPIVLDSAGRASIFLTAQTYDIVIAASTANSQCVPALQTARGVSWATIGSTVSSLISTGNVSIQQSAAATVGANQSSPTDCIQGNYWTGAASAADKWCWQDVLGTGSNPTSTLTSTHTGSSGTKTVSLPSLSVTGGSVLASVNNVQILDGVHGLSAGSTTGGIQEAITACAGACPIWITGPLTITATINVNQTGVDIECVGDKSAINVSFAGDVFNVTAALFKLNNCEVDIPYTAATRATASVVVGGANQGRITHNRFVGNGVIANNGIVFKSTGNGGSAGQWVISENGWPGGVTWSNFALITSAAATAASFQIDRIIGGPTVTDAGIALDGCLDTVKISNIDMPTVGTAIWVRNTVCGANPEFPRWIHCNDCAVEAGGNTSGNTAVKVDSSKDFQYNGGYIASATVGIAFGSVAMGPKVDGVVFTNIGQNAVTTSAGSSSFGVRIINNYFDDTGNQTNNTYDTISCTANSSDLFIDGNHFRIVNANKPRYFINLSGTTDRYYITNNDAPVAAATADVNNTASGSNRIVWGNQPSTFVGNSVNTTTAFNVAQTFNAQWVSNVSTGTAPFTVASTTPVANLTVQNCSTCVLTGTPTGTGISTATMKTGTGAGNYQSASTTYVRVDSTNLAYTVTIPTGWKLDCHASGTALTITAPVQYGVALADGSADNTGILIERRPISSSATVGVDFNLDYIINGDGASHTVNLQYLTTNGADNVLIANATSTFKPVLKCLLTPSN